MYLIDACASTDDGACFMACTIVVMMVLLWPHATDHTMLAAGCHWYMPGKHWYRQLPSMGGSKHGEAHHHSEKHTMVVTMSDP